MRKSAIFGTHLESKIKFNMRIFQPFFELSLRKCDHVSSPSLLTVAPRIKGCFVELGKEGATRICCFFADNPMTPCDLIG